MESKDAGGHKYQLGNIVLAKLRGYPPWPAIVLGPDHVPAAVAKKRPSKDINYYCVRFIPTGNCEWVVSKDLSLLQKHEIEAYISETEKNSGDLFEAYNIALDPRGWEESLERDSEDSLSEEEVEPKSAKHTKKRKRESDASSSLSSSEDHPIPPARRPMRRKNATIDDILSGRLTNPIPAPNSLEKEQSLTVAMAIDRLGIKLMEFSQALREVMPPSDVFRQRANTDAERKSRARELIQRNESHLGGEEMLALLTLFTRDADVADMYVEIMNPEHRELWVKQKLTELGFTRYT